MNITYDNIIFSLQKAGGISIYWVELIKRLQNRQNVFFYENSNDNIFRKKIQLQTQKNSNLIIEFYRYFPFLKKLPSKSIFHSSYYRVSLQIDVVNITTVHDFTYEYFRSGLAKYIHTFQKGFSIKRSDGIICVSENTKRDLMKFFPVTEESKIKVIYNGVCKELVKLENPIDYLVNEFKILRNKKYILFIGDRSNYKNFDVVIQVIKKLKNYSLVIVGGQDFSEKEKSSMLMIEHKVYHFKGLSGDKLNILYNNAFCLLYPSSYEGFGIPIAEAMTVGCPVVSTNRSSIPEVAGDAALLVDKLEADNFANKIRKLENYGFRGDLINRGLEQSKKFCWDKCFEETHRFYQDIWKRKFGG